jgi:chromosome segregation ATPase
MQRSFYSSGYLSNGNISRESYSSPTRSGQYSSTFLRELEKHHDRSIQIANDRLKSQELQHERNLDNLRSQISSLKQQLEHNERSYTREEQRLEEDYNYRLNILQRESDLKTRPVLTQIAEYEKNIERATLSHNSELRELTRAVQELKQENLSLRPRVEVLKAELDTLKNKLYKESQQELALIEQEKKEITRNHHIELEAISESHRKSVSGLHRVLDTRDSRIEELQKELAAKKQGLNELILNSESEIRRLEEGLQTARLTLNKQEREMMTIHSAMNEAKKEAKVLQNEKTAMESDIGSTKKENEYFKTEIKRLERLVYGKGSPRRV